MSYNTKYELPFDLDRYFNRTPNAIEVPLTEIVPGTPHAIEAAGRFMRQAYDGKRSKRDPITLIPRERGGYKCKDGNSTLANAIANQWPTILAVVENDNEL